MNNPWYYALAAVAAVVLFYWLRRMAEKQFIRKLSGYLQNGQYGEFHQMIDKPLVSFLCDPFTTSLMKLHASLLEGDEEETDRIFAYFDQTRMSEKQKSIISNEALNYYVTMEDSGKITHYCELIKASKDQPLKDSAAVNYDIYVRKGYKYLAAFEERLEQADQAGKPGFAMLISRMYANKGDEEKSWQYAALAKKLAKEQVG